MQRRRYLQTAIACALPLSAGCLGDGTSADEEDEQTIDFNETYGADREGQLYPIENGQQMKLAFGDGVASSELALIARHVKWDGPDHRPHARVYVEFRNRTESTIYSYPIEQFSLYEAGTSNEMDRARTFGDNGGYSGGAEVPPGTTDEGYIWFEVDDGIESLRQLMFALYAPADTLKGDQPVDIAWTVPEEESA